MFGFIITLVYVGQFEIDAKGHPVVITVNDAAF